MARLNSHRGKRSRRKRTRRLFAEALESRQLLAADVFAVVDGNQVIIGDHNHDNVVNSHDLGILLNNYHADQGVLWEHGDANADSVVNSQDLGLLLNNFNIDFDAAAQKAAAEDVAPPAPLTDDHVNEIGIDATLIDFSGDHGFSFAELHGELEVAGDVDVFQFTSDADQPFSASLVPFHFGGTTTVELLDADGNLVASGQGEEAFLPVEMDADLEAGLYYVRVSSMDDAIGGYSTRMELGTFVPPPIVDDHVDEIGLDATVIELMPADGALHGTASGEHQVAGDVDVFQFTLESDDTLTASMLPFNFDGSTSMELLDSSGNVLAAAVSDQALSSAEFEAEVTAGLYYVRISSSDDSTAIFYTANITLGTETPPVVVDDHVDVIGPDATPLKFDDGGNTQHAFVEGELGTVDDIDVFQFAVAEETPLRVAFPFVTFSPLAVEVLNADGEVIASAIDTQDQPWEFIETQLVEGTYYLSISSDGATGNYVADVQLGEFIPPPPPPIIDDHTNEAGADASKIELVESGGALFGSVFGTLEESGDIDVFQFELAEDMPLTAIKNGITDGLFDTLSVAELLSEDGTSIASFTFNEQTPVEVNVSLTAGLYYLSLTGAPEDVTGIYFFELQFGEFTPPPFEDDHADQIGEDATLIELVDIGGGVYEGSAFGTIEEPGDFDFFQFELSEDLQLVGFAQGDPFEFGDPPILMDLLDQDGEIVESFAINPTVEFDLQLPAGLYYLAFDGATETLGEYFAELQFGDFPPPPPPPIVDDHVNEIGPAATELQFHKGNGLQFTHASGSLDQPGDIDAFHFTISESTPLSIAAYTFSSTSITADVLDVDGDLIATVTGDSISGYVDASIGAGEYYLTVRGTTEDIEGEYSVDIQLGIYELPPPPIDDHSDEISAATVIEFVEENGALIGFANGLIGTPEDYDVFQFTAEMDEPLSVFVLPDWVGGGTIELLDAEGWVITSLSSQNQFEGLILEADLTAGTYFLRISGSGEALPEDWGDRRFIGPFSDSFDSPFSEYFIEATLGEPTPPPPPADEHVDEVGPDATGLTFDRLSGHAGISGVLGEPGDIDVFQFTVDAAMPIRGDIYMVGEGGITVEILSAATGDTVLQFDGTGDTFYEFEADVEPGTYYLKVSDAGQSEQRFYFGSLFSDSNE